MFNYMDNDKHLSHPGVEFTDTEDVAPWRRDRLKPWPTSSSIWCRRACRKTIMITGGTQDDVLDTYLINPSYSYGG